MHVNMCDLLQKKRRRKMYLDYLVNRGLLIWDGGSTYPVSPSSMLSEHCSGITSFLEFGHVGISVEPI